MDSLNSARQHYDQLLGKYYSWISGDATSRSREFVSWLRKQNLGPRGNKKAIDLGAGHGIHTLALAEVGYEVLAIDFNEQLLSELAIATKNLPVVLCNDDLKNIKAHSSWKPELILCCGDTITHLESKSEIRRLIHDCASCLPEGGRIVLSFRDYSVVPPGGSLEIPVRKEPIREFTCSLKYTDTHVIVTDQVKDLVDGLWKQQKSSYRKVRFSVPELVEWLKDASFTVKLQEVVNGMHLFCGIKE